MDEDKHSRHQHFQTAHQQEVLGDEAAYEDRAFKLKKLKAFMGQESAQTVQWMREMESIADGQDLNLAWHRQAGWESIWIRSISQLGDKIRSTYTWKKPHTTDVDHRSRLFGSDESQMLDRVAALETDRRARKDLKRTHSRLGEVCSDTELRGCRPR
eukprot:1375712-Amphidinium_carterae.3